MRCTGHRMRASTARGGEGEGRCGSPLGRASTPDERLQDSEMALGSDLTTNALEAMVVAGKDAGLGALRQMLSARFTGYQWSEASL